MFENTELRTIDNISRLFIIWSYLLALLALWGRIEFIGRYAKRTREAADMAIEMHGRPHPHPNKAG